MQLGIPYCNKDGEPKKNFRFDEPASFQFEIIAKEELSSLRVLIEIKTENEQEKIIVAGHDVTREKVPSGTKMRFRVTFAPHNLMPGSYPIYFWAETLDSQAFLKSRIAMLGCNQGSAIEA